MVAKRRFQTLCLPFVLFSLVGGVTAQEAHLAERSLPSPFVRLRDVGSLQTTISFDAQSYAALDQAHAAAEPIRLFGLPLPGGDSLDLLLRPTRVMAEGATAVVFTATGERERLAPTVRTFSGHVPGRASHVFLAITPTMLNGYVTLDERLFFLSSGGADAGEATISDSALLPATTLREWCRVVGAPTELGEVPALESGVPKVATTPVFLECDHQYRALFGSDQEALDYAVTLVAATSDVYRRDLGAVLEVPNGYINIYNAVPPWGVVSSFGGLSTFRSWWNSPPNTNKKKRRGQVQLLTAPVFGGVAQSVAAVCARVNAYAISSVYGFFPTPLQHTSSSNWDPFVFAHESGHLYGSQHTFEYVPPIRCQDGSGPDSGTIMSYCHLTYGVGAVGMRFHSRVQAVMAPVIKRAQCAVVIPIQRGDYDYNGVLDALDLAAFDAYLVQGFASLGAEQTFDMNADGVIDSFDRDLLVAQVNGEPPASWALRGTSACLCIFYTQTAPVLGTNWRAVLGYLAPPVLTTAVGTTAPLNPGVATKFGELLIALPGLGGSVVFQSSQMTDGIYAYHDFALPYQLALVGVPLYSQSIVFTQNGPKLTNAIDMVLSIY